MDKSETAHKGSRHYSIFISGVPGVGKTSIAGILAREFNTDIVLSGDYLREFYRGAVPKDQQSMVTQTSVYDAWKFFGDKNSSNIVRGYLEQSSAMADGIIPVIKRANENKENIIIESLYINQEIIDSIKANSVAAFYLYISDRNTHEKRLRERINYTHFGSPGERLIGHLDEYREMMSYSVEICKKNGITTLDNMDFDKTAKDMIKLIREGEL